MKNKLIYFALFAVLPLWAQHAEEGEFYFNNAQYKDAKEVYQALLKKKPKDKLLNYRYARCCYELNEVEESIKHFETAGQNYFLSGFYLGELYTYNYEFEEAVKAYNSYLKLLKEGDENIPFIQYKIAQAELAGRLLLRVEDIAIVDSIVVDKKDFLNFYMFSDELGNLSQEYLVFDSLQTKDKIKYTTQRNDRVFFSDSIEEKMNLFTSYRLLNKWSDPSVLPLNVNFENADNNYPFLLLDGVTLYFSSNGGHTIGGYDIFITKYVPANDAYLTPENIGMPFNSPYNDYMMVIDELNKVGWFATDRYQPQDKLIIYTFIPNEAKVVLRSEDEDFLRRSAQLKTYRQGELPVALTVKTEKVVKEDDKEFEFVIYDQLVYTNREHFKSKEALRKWEILNQEINKNEIRKGQLEVLRNKYASSPIEEQNRLSPQILDMESLIRNEEDKIAVMRIDVCNEEIRYLNTSQSQ